MIDAPVTLTGAFTATAQWVAGGGIITQGANNLTFDQFPVIPSGMAMFSANVTDTGTLVVPAGYEVSPRAFGAVGNNSADDTLAVQRAFNVATPPTPATPAGGHAPIVLDGMFLTISTITASGIGYQWDIHGTQREVTGIYPTATSGDALNFNMTGPTHIKLQNFVINGSSGRAGGSSGNGLTVVANQTAYALDIEHVRSYRNPGYGFSLSDIDQLYMLDTFAYLNGLDGLLLTGSTGSISSLVVNHRSEQNGGRGLTVSTLSKNITFINLESLGDNTSGANPDEVYVAISTNGIQFLSPDIEQQSGTSTIGMTIKGHGHKIDSPIFGSFSSSSPELINCVSLTDTLIRAINVGSATPTYTVATDGASVGNQIYLTSGQTLSYSNTGIANAEYVVGTQVPLLGYESFASPFTPDLARLQYDSATGVSGNIIETSSATGAFTVNNPSNEPTGPFYWTLQITASTTSAAPTFGASYKLNSTAFGTAASGKELIVYFYWDGTSNRQIGTSTWQ